MTIQHIALFRSGSVNGVIVAGAETTDYLGEMVDNMTTHVGVQSAGTVPVAEIPKRSGYAEQLRQPLQSGNYHLQKGGSRWDEVSFIDWWTFLPAGSRQRIADTLFEHVVSSDAVGQVAQKDDIGYVLAETLPYVGQHGVETLIGDRIWDYLCDEERDTLSEHSQRALENGQQGQRFEQFFRELCEENGVRCWKRSAQAFKQFQPDAYSAVWNELGTMNGIPDFFVKKPNTHNLNTWMDDPTVREWEPEGRFGFVEVKYNESTLSPHQRTMIDCLIEHGQEVWVLNGDEEHYRFEEIG